MDGSHVTPGRTDSFAATRWSIVIAAAGGSEATNSRRALEELAGLYWFPLYSFIRRRGHDHAQAEDLTQEFFARLLEKKFLNSVDPAKGKFRSFLLACVKHFLANEWEKSQSIKRGGAIKLLSLDGPAADARYEREQADNLTPERLFERRWALAVLEQVMNRLQIEHAAAGKADLFEALKSFLAGEGDSQSYATIGERLNMTAGAVKVAVHRLRSRYRQLLKDEIAQTVADPGEVEEEIRYLLSCL
jgi:RNA polymerase sigma-70 factor (ECF subfamily)